MDGLTELMKEDKNTMLLTADLGWNSFDHIRENYSSQFMNLGLSEQAMVGIAAGMAKMGKNVFAYSIIPFLIYRAFEQLRNDICYHDLPVRLVGTGAGFAYGEAGSTHHPFEDLRVAGALPNLVILNPSDQIEVKIFLQKMKGLNHPVYMRLGRSGEPILHDKLLKIDVGKPLKLNNGEDVLIISTGTVTGVAIAAAKKLNAVKEVAEVLEIHTFKPFDDGTIRKEAEGKKVVVTIEDNNGALEDKVANALINTHKSYNFISFRTPDQFAHTAGRSTYMLDLYGITSQKVIERVMKVLK